MAGGGVIRAAAAPACYYIGRRPQCRPSPAPAARGPASPPAPPGASQLWRGLVGGQRGVGEGCRCWSGPRLRLCAAARGGSRLQRGSSGERGARGALLARPAVLARSARLLQPPPAASAWRGTRRRRPGRASPPPAPRSGVAARRVPSRRRGRRLAELPAQWVSPRDAHVCRHELLAPDLACQVEEEPGEPGAACQALQSFIRRVSLLRPKMRFHYCVNVQGAISAQTYCEASQAGVCVLSGTELVADWRRYIQPGPPGTPVPCGKLHPVLGRAARLLLPAAVAEAGISGELSLVPAAALCPCLRPLPNQPAQLNTVSVFCYDPAGLPLPAAFLRDPVRLADWERHGYVATPDPGPGPKEGLARPDARYLLHRGGGEAAEPGAQPQTLLLFLLLRYADPFQDPPVCDAWTREVLVSHVEQILGCSAAAVREAVQGVVDAALEEDACRQRSQRRLCQALPVVLEAVSSVVSSSTSARFRRACLQSWQVSDTPELVAALSGALTGVTRRRRLPRRSCTDPGPSWAGSSPGQSPLPEEASGDTGTPRSEPAGEAAGEEPEPKRSRRASGTPEEGQSRDRTGSSQDLSQADELWLQETRSLSEWAS